jgi:6,7-dimethyl-8-ribityllumazine synthase
MVNPAPSVLIIEARYYEDISDELARGATEELRRRDVGFERVSVPGALEIPVALSAAIKSGIVSAAGRHQGCIALGCVIRGETSHYDIVANESTRAILEIAVANAMPLGNGILTVDSREQAWARASVDGNNKGGDAARACAELLDFVSEFSRKKQR